MDEAGIEHLDEDGEDLAALGIAGGRFQKFDRVVGRRTRDVRIDRETVTEVTPEQP